MWRDNKLLMQLFEPEELEALVCGGTDLDFNALQRAAKYEDGFDEKSEVSLCCTHTACGGPLANTSPQRSAWYQPMCMLQSLGACSHSARRSLHAWHLY